MTWPVAIGYGVAEAIIKAAEHTEGTSYDLLAMATHGNGAFKRFLMGSVTEHIVGHSKLPLLLDVFFRDGASILSGGESARERACFPFVMCD